MRRLLPSPATAVVAVDAYADANRRRHDGRPWVGICMVASVDGATAVDGRSGGLSNATDAAVLSALRQHADVVLVGAGTVRAEGYGAPKRPGLRIGVVSSGGVGLDFGSPLFASGAGFVVTTLDAPDLPVDTVRAGHGRVDLLAACGHLDGDFAHVEGGARLNGALLDAGVVDEVNLTISPLLAGGASPRPIDRARDASAPLRLAHLLEEDGFLFTRWLRASVG
jgi:riboflavin biosynthesis pyrimidine reductase